MLFLYDKTVCQSITLLFDKHIKITVKPKVWSHFIHNVRNQFKLENLCVPLKKKQKKNTTISVSTVGTKQM